MAEKNSFVAAILAGGEGRRFWPFTYLVPKPMIPIGSSEKPLLDHIVSWLARHGVTRIILLVGYKWRQVYNYFRDGSHLGVEIEYSIDSDEYHDTGGALLKALLEGKHRGARNVLVWYGDILAPVDVESLLEAHMKSRAHATLVVAEKYQVPVGVAEVDRENNVVRLEEKPWLPLKATIGVLVVKPELVLEGGRALGGSFDIMGDLIPWAIERGYRVKAFVHEKPWYDVGSLERYQKFSEDALQGFLS